MSPRDADYYRARAIEERGLAKDADRANVAAIHEELSRQYDALAEQAELRPTLPPLFPDDAPPEATG